jgi:glycosyltransferase involved in cell wall biosynthesis
MSRTISVLIPTFGRETEVINTIDGLLKQTHLPDEIIVVDQNGDRYPALDRYLQSIPRVRQIKTQTPGVAINYNLALRNAQGDIVLYVDDDVVPEPGLIAAHLLNYDREPQLGGVAGRVECLSGDPDPYKISEIGSYHPWSGSVIGNFNGLKRQHVKLAQGANMSFDRQALLAIGGFDQGFQGNGYFFESDGSLRVLASGRSIIFDPEAALIHLQAPSGGARVKDKADHTYFYVRNGIRLYRRHSPVIGNPLIGVRMFFYVAAKAAYNSNLRILFKGLRAIFDGWAQDMRVKSNVQES